MTRVMTEEDRKAIAAAKAFALSGTYAECWMIMNDTAWLFNEMLDAGQIAPEYAAKVANLAVRILQVSDATKKIVQSL